ncbi:hypothetical protein [Acinetobacter sp. BY484]|uniref:hypothetical protein n=1 Tax=Acinetobacter sp. BY484 TaxID=2820674 RepID=UPI001C23CFD9|nr:hypothetical protein [Acinetobacter sp. BY484]
MRQCDEYFQFCPVNILNIELQVATFSPMQSSGPDSVVSEWQALGWGSKFMLHVPNLILINFQPKPSGFLALRD